MLEVKQGDNHSREKCSGMAEQTQCGSHPDYPSKSQDPSVKASIFLRSCLCFLPMAVKQQLHLWGWDQLRSWLITSELCTLFLPEWLKNESCSQTAGPLPLGSTNTPLPKHVTSLELRSCLRSLLSLSFLAISPRARRWPWSAPRLPSPLSAQQLWTAGLHLLQDFCPHPPEPLPKPPMRQTLVPLHAEVIPHTDAHRKAYPHPHLHVSVHWASLRTSSHISFHSVLLDVSASITGSQHVYHMDISRPCLSMELWGENQLHG